ncbi:hypothetical protein FAUST_11647 [Fusarium austroamericanum]|uniref:Uncharacterized protein n=1 Tax=Fusarium austroamericanum TaxID=282268 RepID=A0AAN6BU16_FUSAU|nr:hypothetical protein FAUST_11647 [Fusarium austroamericanum]
MMARRHYGSGEDTSTASEEDDDFGSSAKLSKPLDSYAFKDDEGQRSASALTRNFWLEYRKECPIQTAFDFCPLCKKNTHRIDLTSG